MESIQKMQSVRDNIIHYIYGIPALLASFILSGFLCMIAAICYFRAQVPDPQILQNALMSSLILVLNALPGLAIFMLWIKSMDRNGGLAIKKYTVGNLILDAPLCAALVAMSSMTTCFTKANFRMVIFAEQFLAIFASIGFLTAIFYWLVSLCLKSTAVTLLKESAKKELYSQF